MIIQMTAQRRIIDVGNLVLFVDIGIIIHILVFSLPGFCTECYEYLNLYIYYGMPYGSESFSREMIFFLSALIEYQTIILLYEFLPLLGAFMFYLNSFIKKSGFTLLSFNGMISIISLCLYT